MADNRRTSVWRDILKDTKTFSESRKLQEITIIVIGPMESGKSSLIKKLNLTCSSSPGHSDLEYGFNESVPIENEDDEQIRMHVWCVNGDGGNASIDWQLRQALTKDNLDSSIVLLTSSIDNISQVLPSLESQVRSLEKHALWMEATHSIYNEKVKSLYSSIHSEIYKPHPVQECKCVTLDMFMNVPVISVITKSDNVNKMTNTEDGNELMTFLTLELRRFSTKYGTALMFHSSAGDINLDILKSYITHLTLGSNFNTVSHLQRLDSIFIPRGVDREVDIVKDEETFLKERRSHVAGSLEDMKKLLLESPNKSSSCLQPEIVECLDNQEFLESLREMLSIPHIREAKVKFSEPVESTEGNVVSSPMRFSLTPRMAHDSAGALTIYFQSLLNNSPGRSQNSNEGLPTRRNFP